MAKGKRLKAIKEWLTAKGTRQTEKGKSERDKETPLYIKGMVHTGIRKAAKDGKAGE